MFHFSSWLRKTFPGSFRTRKRTARKKDVRSLLLERLEDRVTPSSGAATTTYIAFPLDHPGTSDGGQGSFGGAFTPSNIQTAYGLSSLYSNGDEGAGETIAVIDAFDDPSFVSSTSSSFDSSDLHQFDQEFGLPDPPSFTKIGQVNNSTTFTSNFSTSGVPGTDPSGPGTNNWEGEEALDVEWAHAIAPKANIILVEADNNDTGSTPDLEWAADWAATPVADGGGGANVVSMSFGVNGGYSGETSTDSAYAPLSFPEVTFVASAGDSGSVNPVTGTDGNGSGATGQAGYPADSADVLAVGGTSLTVVGNGNYAYQSESVWNNGSGNGGKTYEATGGGISNFESQPAYQASAAAPFSTTQRTAPDVSFLADPDTGVVVYDSYNGSDGNNYFQFGGTSLSSPCWAGLVAIADQIRAGAGESALGGPTQALPILYDLYGNATTYSNDFHDVTSGNNGTNNAGTGYDLDTGIGTPIANTMVPNLADVGQMIYISPSGTNNYILKESSGILNLTDNGTLVDSQPVSATTSITIGGGGTVASPANNSLTIDFSGGQFDIPVSFDGGAGNAAHTLTLKNGIFTNATYTYTGTQSGSVNLDGQVITFSRTSSVANTSSAANDTFDLAAGAHAKLQDDGTNNNGISEIASTNSGFVTTTFSDPSSSLTVNTAGSSSVVQLAAMDNGFAPTSETFSGSANDTFQFTAAGAVPSATSVTITTSTLDLDGLSPTINALNGSGTIIDSAGSTTSTLTVGAGGGTGSFSGVIQNGSGTVALTLNGSGAKETLSGANTYSGATTITAGTLADGANNALPTGTALSITGTFDLNGFSQQVASVTGSGTATDSSGTAGTFTVNNSSADTFAGNLTGKLALTKTASGTLTLTGTGSSYSGATTISAGTLQVGANNAIPSTTDVTDNATLDLDGNNDIIGALAGSGTVTSSVAGAVTLTVGATNDGATFSGVIQNGSGTVALTKTGSGTEIISGTSNTYSGATTGSAGILEVDGTIVSNVTISGTGTLDGTGTTGTVTATAGSLTPGDSPGVLTTGSLNLHAGSSFNIAIGGNSAGNGAGHYSQDDVASGNVTLDTSGSGVALNLSASSYTPTTGDVYFIINNGGGNAISGTFVAGAGIDNVSPGAALPEGTVLSTNFLNSGLTATITYDAGSNHNSVAIVVSGTDITVSIGNPSATITNTGPVTYSVTYHDADGETVTSNLTTSNVHLIATGTATGTLGFDSNPGGDTRTVTISNISGNGTLAISIDADSADDQTGNQAPAAGPSTTFIVDNTPPTSAIGYPVSAADYNTSGWSGTISGTASDAIAGVASVALSIEQLSSGDYWNGSSFVSGVQYVSVSGTTSWSYSFAASHFPADGSYTVQSVATDNAGNLQTSNDGLTFTYDNTPPTSTISYPLSSTDYNASGWSGSIAGTASDATSGVASIELSIEQLSTGDYWNGSSFVSGVQYVSVSGTTSWSYSFAASRFPADGSYTVQSLATDNAGNLQTTNDSLTFTYDNTPPTSAISSPVSGSDYNASGWSGSIAGSASDATSGVASVKLSIEQLSSGDYWNGSSFVSGVQYVSVSGTTSWTYSFATGNFPADGSYTVQSLATDNAGNVQTSNDSLTFTYDNTPPTSTISSPTSGSDYNASGWSGSISGTASDTTSGVASVKLSIEQLSTGDYWNGSGFVSGVQYVSVTGTSSWSYSFTTGNFPADGSYTVQSLATDNAGNLQTTNDSLTFVYDNTPPTSTISSPVSGSDYNASGWSGSIAGTASDATSGVASVALSIEQLSTGDYWNGSSFVSGVQYVGVSGTTSWTYSFAASHFPADGSYTVQSVATDNAGNLQTTNDSLTFVYDNTPPTSAISSPVSGSDYNASGWSGSISGNASDATSGVASVKLSIEQDSSGDYWNGSSFVSGVQYVSVSGTTSWSYSFVASHFPADGSYTVQSIATDNAGNVQTSNDSLTFTYDNTPPTSTISYPLSSTDYNASGWSGTISGAASDATSGVASVALSIEQVSTGDYWNGSSFVSGVQYVSVSGTTSWTYTFAASHFPADGSYTVQSLATDNAGNVQTSNDSLTFVYDNTPPTSTISYPLSSTDYNASGWSGTISGAANDATSGVASVELSIEQLSTGDYWNGSSFVSGVQYVSVTGTTSWSYSFAAGNFPADGSYTVQSLATDNTGNLQTTNDSLTFTYDNTPPTSTISSPVSGSDYNASGWSGGITGTASDATSGVASVKLSIEQVSSGDYWNGSSFVSGVQYVSVSGTTSWTYSFATGNFPADGSYTVQSIATDNAGNVQTTNDSLTFTYDNTPPTSAISSPVSGSDYNASGWSGSIAGSASDATSGVASVKLSIEQLSTGDYWNGSGFVSGVQYVSVSGTTSWTYSFATGNFPADGSYTVQSLATDNAGNAQTSNDSLTFVYDNTPPTSTISSPTSGSDYNASGWSGTISGSASDATSGVASVKLSIEQLSTGDYWNGSSFVSGVQYVSVSGTTSWTYSFAASHFPADGSYTVQSLATDNAGNLQTSNDSLTFVYDNTPPTSTISTPVSGSDYNASGWSGSIAGSASDATSGVASVKLSIEQLSSGDYWNGSSFVSGVQYVSVTGTSSWSYSFATSNFPADGSYTVQSLATDNAGNLQTSNDSLTFVYDNTPPTSTISSPVSGSDYNAGGWSGTISGAASDATSGVASVALSIEQLSTGDYWNGSSFVSGVQYVSVTGTTSWTYTFAASHFPADGSYTVQSLATDNAGNVQTTNDSLTFTYDNTPPTSTITYPLSSTDYNASGWSGSIAGSASDATSGVASVKLSIEQLSSGDYWNGSSFVSGVQYVSVTGTSSWSYSFAASHFPADGSYTVQSLATDNAGNLQTSNDSLTFVYDNTPPTSAITYPVSAADYNASGWSGSIAGTASDATSGVASVALSIEQLSTGDYWNGSSFVSGVQYVSVSGTTGWTYSFATGNFPADGSYTVQSLATDNAGNVQTSNDSLTFTYDNTPPTSTISSPVGGSDYNVSAWSGTISGTASDATSGVASVALSIEQDSSGDYWNGSNFVSGVQYVSVSGTTSWTYSFATGNFPADGSYTVQSLATDNAGNVQTSNDSLTFTYDNTPPTSTISSPVSGSDYNASGWSGTISGSASDATSGVASVKLSIEQLSTGDYWNGSSFVSGVQYVSVSGTTSWTYSFAASHFPADGSYTVQSLATDNAGNLQTSNDSLTFVYDNTPPTSTISTPVSGSDYNASGWSGSIAGSASDATSGVASVKLSIEQLSSGDYWNGSSFVSGVQYVSVTGTSSWSYSFATSNFPADGSYTVQSLATDNAGNLQTSNDSLTFVYDNTPPTSTISSPVSGSDYNAGGWSGTISGAASDATSGVASVALSIEQLSTGDYWNGSSFVSGVQYVSVTGTTSWTYTFAASHFPADGSYTVQSLATDNAGNVQTTNDSLTFTYDNTPPTSTITYPLSSTDYNASGWSGSIAGSASDATSGVASVKLSIEQLSSGDYWNGSSFVSGVQYVSVTGTSSWSYSFAASHFPADGSYTVQSLATDNAGNLQTSNDSLTFVYDNTPPTSAITYPVSAADYNASGWSGSIAGTASDATSGVASVALSIEQLSTGDYWNGSSFVSGVQYVSVSGTTGWTYSFATGNFPADGSYTVQSLATDNAGNVQTSNDSLTFTYDNTPPTSTISSPVSGSDYNASAWSGTISGSASDATSGVASVKLSIEQISTGDYWNGSSFVSGVQYVSVTGTISWTYTFAASHFPADGSYTVQSLATDNAGNLQTSNDSLTFIYDNTPPTSTISYPLSSTDYNASGWSGTISGAASDATSGVASVKLSIEQLSTGDYWNGSSFVSGVQYVSVTGTTSWTYSFAASHFPADGSYTVQSLATDNAGNLQTSNDSLTFTYDNTPPTSTISFPLSSTDYNATSWNADAPISGTAFDATSGVASVELSIEQLSTGDYWNGSSFVSGVQYASVSGTTSWSYAFAASHFPADGSYTVQSIATDNAGNLQTSNDNLTFTYDNTPPTSAISFPLSSTDYNAASWNADAPISGAANDATSGVASVKLSIEQLSTGDYWNGSSFVSGVQYVSVSGTTSWTYSFATGNFPADGSYTVQSLATDNAGNAQTSNDSLTFVYDNTPPTSTITYPVSAADYNASGWTGSIAGSASDATSGVASVKLSIEQLSTGDYWNGSSFVSGVQYVGVTGTTSWTCSFAASHFPADGSYTVQSIAIDNAGNVQTSNDSLTFVYDNTPPTSTISTPVSDSDYNASGWSGTISGTASDAIAGVASVALSIEQVSSGDYWNGSSFVSGVQYVSVTGTTSWSYSFAASNFPADGSYTVQSIATDNAGNLQTNNDSLTFTYDNTPPTSTISSPTSGSDYNASGWSGTIAGTASDATSGVASVKLSIEQVSTGDYWNGSSFVSGVQYVSVSGTTSWTYSFPASHFPADGSYTVQSIATDNAGNVQTSNDSLTFTYDNTPPTSSISYPLSSTDYNASGWSGSISGSASDTTSGVTSVKLSIEQISSGDYWDGSSFVSGVQYVSVTGTTSWSYTFAASNFPADGSYTVQSLATDNAGNVQTSNDSLTFVYDNTPPTSTISYPVGAADYNASGWSGSIAGTASDATSGVASVELSIELDSTGDYWNGGSFVSGVQYVSVTGTTSWSYSFPAGDFPASGNYTVQSLATDNAGNLQTSNDSLTFTYNNTAPISTITYPVSDSDYNASGWSGSFAGTASDATSGVASVALSIEQLSTGDYWNGSSFVSGVQYVSVTGTTSWTYSFATSHFPADGSYTVQSLATDNAGNAQTTNDSLTFTYDNTPPTSTITYPLSSTDYNASGWSGSIAGSASDATSGVASVKLSIEQLSSGDYWNGSSFVSGVQYVSVTGTSSWSYSFTTGNFPADGSYTVQSLATDNAGNLQTSNDSLTFVYDNTPPTSTISSPTSGSDYNASAWSGTISGSASDATSGVASVKLSIEQLSTGDYWNGSGFVSGVQYVSVTGTTSWSYSFAASHFPADGSYTVQSLATDNAGNLQTSNDSLTFTYNNTAPISTITYPVSAADYNASGWSGSIAGSASDATSGVASVKLSIEQLSSGDYWNGSSFVSGVQYVSVTGTTSWSYSFAASHFPADGSYTVQSLATDNAGNVQTSNDSLTFTYDNTPPTSAISSPVSGSDYNASGWSGTISGSASDATSGVASVKLSIEQLSSGDYWNGSSFVSGVQYVSVTGTTSWTYSFATSHFPADGSYTVQSLATDNAGNAQTTNDSLTFTYDNTPPTSTITYPLSSTDYNASGWSGSIAGSASDATSGVASVKLSIEQLSSGDYWNGSSFVGSVQYVSVTGTSSWSYSFAASNFPADGSYTVQSLATDNAGNVQTTNDSLTFTYDSTPPSSTISSPVSGSDYNASAWSGTISGSASDATSGVASVKLSIEQLSTGDYWNGSSFVSVVQYVSVTGTTSWTYTFAASHFPANGSYTVQSLATDNAGNVQTSNDSLTFVYDNTPPTSAISSPVSGSDYNASGWSGTIGGTAGDATSGVASVKLSIEQLSTGDYWNGSSFVSGVQYVSVTGTTSWSYSFIASNFPADGSYTVQSLATDNAGNVQTSNDNLTFVYDNTPPTSAISYPLSSTDYNASGWSGSIAGSASDAISGVASVKLSIEQLSSGDYWNGSSFVSGVQYVSVTGTASWAYTFAANHFPADGSYTVQSLATDNAGNLQTTNDSLTFTYDSTPPSSTISSPVSGSDYNASAWSGTISGSASDATSGVASVKLSIEQLSTGDYWDGSSFVSGVQYVSVTGTTSWTYTFAAGNFPADGSYTVQSLATDNAGNLQTTNDSLTFTYDNTPPTSTISTPVSSADYNASGWSGTISGAANDATSGVASIELSIEQLSTSDYWNGSSFVSGVQYVSVSGTSSWSYSFAASHFPADGSYTVQSLATDNAGNVQTTNDGLTFTYDNTPPTSTISAPVSGGDYNASGWSGMISGSASDATSGVASVKLSIEQDSSGDYWNGSSFVSGIQYVSVSGTSSWTYTFAASHFPADGSYTVQSLATDNAGNVQTTNDSLTFVYDNTPPISTISYPVGAADYNASGWSGSIAGTASDATSGVASVELSIEQDSTGDYWNGGSFVSGVQYVSVTGTTSWSYSFSAGDFPASGNYTVQSLATDNAGNLQTSNDSLTFVYDNTPPTSAISYPLSSTDYNASGWSGSIAGSASDAISGVASVKLSIEQLSSGDYWNGSSFVSGVQYVSVTGTTSWSYSFAASNFPADGSYTVQSLATDNAGNLQTTNDSLTFTYDSTPPSSTISSPVSGSDYNASAWSGTISGSASDATSGVASVKLSIEQVSSGDYWNGSSFVSSVQYVSVSGTTSWTYAFAASHFPADGSYTVQSLATDNAGNVQTTNDSLTFVYDNTPPISTISYPVGAADYNASGWSGSIAGTASDATSGVASVELSIEQDSTGDYWNGGSFVSGVQYVSVTGTTSWSYSFSAGDFPASGNYTVQSLATDNAGNLQTSNDSLTFTFNNTTPTSTITYPVSAADYNASGWSGTISGSASDVTSGVASVALSIEQDSTSKYWNGSGFVSGVQYVSVSGTTSWSYTFAASHFPADGSYTVQSIATDNAGNVQTSNDSLTFTYDNTPPTSSISYPISSADYNASGWSGSIAGTASDATSGVASVKLSIEQLSSGDYWNGSSFVSGVQYVSASGTNSWTYSFAASNFPADGSYTVQSLATDNAGNVQTTNDSLTFVYDNTSPTSTISYPLSSTDYNASGWSGGISGAASDATSGVASVKLSIEQVSTGDYWNGSSFVSGVQYVSVTGTTSWTYSFAASNFPAAGSYTVQSIATDNAGNVQTSNDSLTFTYDNTPPTSSISYPISSADYNASGWSGSISGTAGDATSGVASVRLSIEQDSTGDYWNGSSFVSGVQYVSVTGTTSWSYTFATSHFPADGSYTVQSLATDNAGNVQTSNNSLTFTYDNTAPTSTISSPISGSDYNAGGWTGSIAGSASDVTSGVASAKLSIEQLSSGDYWNGSSFVSGVQYVSVSGTTSWTYSFAAGNFPADGSYTIQSVATDKAGNVQTSNDSLTFTYDNTPPTSTISSPDSGSYYNASGWSGTISGSASDAASGVASVKLSIEQDSTGYYWSGGSFVSGVQYVSVTGTTSWMYAFAAGNFPAAGSYTVRSLATDNASNVQTTNDSLTFVYDNTSPTVTIGSPSTPSTATGPVTYTVTYADPYFASSSLTTSNITLIKTGSANGSVSVSGSGTSYTVTISNITGNGTLGISIAADTAVDLAGNEAPAAGPSQTFIVNPNDTGVTAIQIDDGTAQRSMVRSITLTFSSSIASTLSSVMAALSLTRASGGPSVGLTGTLNSTGTVLTLTFTGSSIIGGSLADGRYTLAYGSVTLLSSSQLWRLFGDLYGTASVTAADETAFLATLNSRKGMSNYSAYFDYTESGEIVNADETQFMLRYGTSI